MTRRRFRGGSAVILTIAVVGIASAFDPGVSSAAFTRTASATTTLSTATLQPPTAPSTSGSCSLLSGNSITVTWTPTASIWASGYVVYRSTTNGSGYTVISSPSGRTTSSYTDNSVAFSTTYYYVIEAAKGNWRSVRTPQVSRTTRSALCL